MADLPQEPDQAGLTRFDDEGVDSSIRREEHDGRLFFSVIDVVGVLTEAPKPRMYWADMKRCIVDEGFRELLATCQQLKMTAPDGKQRLTDAADTETLLRIIQSIPSPKAEPAKQWLAQVGVDRLREEADDAARPPPPRAGAPPRHTRPREPVVALSGGRWRHGGQEP